MNQDKEAMIVLALGILFCLIIIIVSFYVDQSTTRIFYQLNDGNAGVQYGLTLAVID